MIDFFNEDVELPDLKYGEINEWLTKTATNYNFQVAQINYIFCSDDYLLKLNQEYLSHDYYTDIITFNYNELSYLSGDIFISVDRVKENALLFGIDYEMEFLRVLVHGVLHLIGFNDSTDTEEKIMREKEDEHINLFLNA